MSDDESWTKGRYAAEIRRVLSEDLNHVLDEATPSPVVDYQGDKRYINDTERVYGYAFVEALERGFPVDLRDLRLLMKNAPWPSSKLAHEQVMALLHAALDPFPKKLEDDDDEPKGYDSTQSGIQPEVDKLLLDGTRPADVFKELKGQVSRAFVYQRWHTLQDEGKIQE